MTEYRPLNTSPEPVRLRIEDYLLLDAAGAFDGYAKTELIEGQIVYMNAQHRPHARIKSRLHLALAEALQTAPGGWEAMIEASVAIPPSDTPEPDIVITSESEGEGLVPVESVALIVEVSDTTLAFDLGPKAALYAQAGVPEYWVADVTGRTIHQHGAPTADGYRERETHAFGARLRLIAIAGLEIDTAAIG